MKLCKRLFICSLTVTVLAGCEAFCSSETAPRTEEKDYSDFFGDSTATVVFHLPKDDKNIVYNIKEAGVRHSPCSTFKIVSTLMGLESGAASPDAKLGYDGAKYEFESWNHDLTLKEAFRASCVWYYKKLTDKLRKSYVQETLDRLHYGNCDLGAWDSRGHNAFWLESTLQISPLEQVKVLSSIFGGKSGFKPEHVETLKDFMKYESIGPTGFYGKTGTGRNHKTKRLEGWLIGFLELQNREIVYYAVHVSNPEKDVSGPDVREIVRKIVGKTFAVPKSCE